MFKNRIHVVGIIAQIEGNISHIILSFLFWALLTNDLKTDAAYSVTKCAFFPDNENVYSPIV